MEKEITLEEKKEITRKNLLRVLEELPKLAEKYFYIRDEFDMTQFGVYCNLYIEDFHECKTNGCLLGNIARIFEDEIKKGLFQDRYGLFSYDKFGRKYFPYLYIKIDRNKNLSKNIIWEYLFDTYWANTKFNDFDSAIERIKNILDNDLECNKFSYDTNQIIKK